jgi:hypothetical protein
MQIMNLGVIYIKTAIAIVASGIAVGAMATAIFLVAKKNRILSPTFFFGTPVIGILLGCVGLAVFQEPLFRTWHRLQNEAVPAEGCVTYEPSFWCLHAIYQMDRQSFDRWVASHPWGLAPCESDSIFELHDGPYFGLSACDAIYESPRGPKGNNLRVYYRNGMAYLSYSAM